MRNFTYEASTRIIFGQERLVELPLEIKKYTSKVLLAYGEGSIKKSGLYDKVLEELQKEAIVVVELPDISANPQIESVRMGVTLCRKHQIDFVLAVGGGSVINCAKAIAAAVPYQGDAWDFFIRKAKVKNPISVGAILTLAATGSEMNGGMVISNALTHEKRAAACDSLRPKFAFLDPSLTFTVNKWHTGAGVVDIMSHLFEQYFTPDKGAFLQDAIAEGILKTCIHYGPIVLADGSNYEARANLMWASSIALNGLTVTGKYYGDWATHNMEHELSAHFDLTHGAGLAILFPLWMAYVLSEETAPKLAQYARNVWDVQRKDDHEAALEGIRLTRLFFNKMGMPATFREAGMDASKLDLMVEGACKFGSFGLFKRLDKDDVRTILTSAL